MAELFVNNDLAFDYKEYMAMATAPANAVEVRARISMIEGSANPLGGDQAFVVDDVTKLSEQQIEGGSNGVGIQDDSVQLSGFKLQ